MVDLAMHPVLQRNNVNIIGQGDNTYLLAHGFGCDQSMWRYLLPFLDPNAKIVLFDYTGCGGSDVSYFDPVRYSSLDGYASDLLEICDALALEGVTFIGHSVSSVIGVLAANQRPSIFARMIFVCPSPCFLNLPPEYHGGLIALI